MAQEPRWFASSRRTIGGIPDARFGWLDTPGGPQIVKRLDIAIDPLAAEHVRHEAQMLQFLAAASLAAPRLVAWRPDRLQLAFAGLTLRQLAAPVDGLPACPPIERLTALVHLLPRLQAYADAGVLPVDLWAGNIAVPLTSIGAGRLRLNVPMLIDHAHTVCAGRESGKPLWINHKMRRIAPEVATLIERDQQQLGFALRRAGLDTGSARNDDAELRARFAAVWQDYAQPQALQRALDSGTLRIVPAIAWAIGLELAAAASAVGGPQGARVATIAERMTGRDPQARPASLAPVHRMLEDLLAPCARIGSASYPRLRPEMLGGTLAGQDSERSGGSQSAGAALPEDADVLQEPPPSEVDESDGANACAAYRWGEHDGTALPEEQHPDEGAGPHGADTARRSAPLADQAQQAQQAQQARPVGTTVGASVGASVGAASDASGGDGAATSMQGAAGTGSAGSPPGNDPPGRDSRRLIELAASAAMSAIGAYALIQVIG